MRSSGEMSCAIDEFSNLGPSRVRSNAAHGKGEGDAPKVLTITTPPMAMNITFTDFAKESKSVVLSLGNRIFLGFVVGALISKFKWPL